MRAVVQRVARAQVEVDGRTVASIGPGLVAFVAVEAGDDLRAVRSLAERLVRLRLLAGAQGRLERSVLEAGGELLLVSNLTVAGEVHQGRKVSLSRAAPFDRAQELFDALVEHVRSLGVGVQTGRFGAYMRVTVVNDGPVTVVVELARP